MKSFKDLGIKPVNKGLEGKKIDIDRIFNEPIIVNRFQVKDSKYPDKNYEKCLHLEIEFEGRKRVVFTGSKVLIDTITQIPEKEFPFATKIIKENGRFEFV
jgi:hypothetical protein